MPSCRFLTRHGCPLHPFACDGCHTSRDQWVFRIRPGDPLHTSTSHTRRKRNSSSTRKPCSGSQGVLWDCVSAAGGEGGVTPRNPSGFLAFSSPLSFQVESEVPQNLARSRLSSFRPGNWTSFPPSQEIPERAERATCEKPRRPPAPARVWRENRALRGGGASAQARAAGFALTFPSVPLAPKCLPCLNLHPWQFHP